MRTSATLLLSFTLGAACTENLGGALITDGGSTRPDGTTSTGNGGLPTEEQTGDPLAPGAAAVPANAKRVFVTSSRYPGDLKTTGKGATGLEGADNICKTAAEAVALGGTWRAWLSSKSAGGEDAIDRVTAAGPWYRLDGVRAFNNKAGLMTSPLVAVNIDEKRKMVFEHSETWTGTGIGGSGTGSDCAGWTGGASAQSTVGRAYESDQRWTDLGPRASCGDSYRLYCLEQ